MTVSALLPDEYLLRLYNNQPTNWLQIIGCYAKRLLALLEAKKFDLLWIEKELFPNLPAWFEQILHALAIPYLVDYDDAIFHRYEYSQRRVQRYLRGKIDRVMANAAVVVCGNEYLAERARSTGAKRVEVIPTVVDADKYVPAARPDDRRPVIGWIGSPSTVKYLHVVTPALMALRKEREIAVRTIGARFAVSGLDTEFVPWCEKSEVEQIRSLDIGIMPLEDSPWERGKCGYKLIQYMACALPVVASPVGVNIKLVSHGINGFLATTAEEWKTALRTLCDDVAERKRMGAAGRRLVEREYCLQVTAPRIATLLSDVVRGRKT